MKINDFIAFAAPVLLLFTTTSLILKENKFEAVLETELQNNLLTVNSMFMNNSSQEVNYSYRLKSERSGKAGKSITNLSGNAKANAGQLVKLSQTSFSISEGDSYVIELEILNNKEIVANHIVVYPK